MEYAKITIKPLSPFITKLQSDTIFGHFAWGIVYRYNEEKLKELLKDFEKRPFIIFSDGFIKDFLPKPFLKSLSIDSNCDELIDNIKKLKKLSLVPKELVFENIDNLKEEVFLDYIKNSKSSFKKATNIITKNSINRLTNSVTEGLYYVEEEFLYEEIDIYFAYDGISKEFIEEIFDLVSVRGFGKDKSTGKGRFSFKIDWDFKEKEYFTTKRDKYLNLSTMLINKENMFLYYGKTLTKFPKTGGFYANSHPFKNPIICYKPGSTFLVKDSILGRAEKRVFNKEDHYQNGYSIGIYFNGE